MFRHLFITFQDIFFIAVQIEDFCAYPNSFKP
jgi:hypothetical protein